MPKSPAQVVPSIRIIIRRRDVVVVFLKFEVVDDVVSVYEWKHVFEDLDIRDV